MPIDEYRRCQATAGGTPSCPETVGSGFLGRKILEAIAMRAGSWLSPTSGRERPMTSLLGIAVAHGVPVAATRNVNDEASIRTMRAWKPDLMVSVYLSQRIGAELLEIPARGTLNVHSSLLPRHRGIFPVFWALAEKDRETGVTVHWVDEGLDTGDVLVQHTFAIADEATTISLSFESADVGAQLLTEAIDLVGEGGDAPRTRQSPVGGSYHSWPTREDQRRFKLNGGRYGSLLDLLWSGPRGAPRPQRGSGSDATQDSDSSTQDSSGIVPGSGA